MIRTTHLLVAGLLAAMPLTGAVAVEADVDAKAREYMEGTVAAWMADPLIVDAINAQNAANAGLTDADIAALDEAWSAEADIGGGALFETMLANAVSQALIAHETDAGGMIVQIWIMDNRGLNVGQSALTGDLNQGDEAKWMETYAVGAGAIHVSDVEFDQEVQAYVVQSSMTVVDPATGAPIGAVTVGINAEFLM
jgi:hypothetical protein